MDFHTAHNIVHQDAGNNSNNCGVCNGSIDKKACEAKAGEILKNQQTRKSNNSMGYYADEKGKDEKDTKTASEKDANDDTKFIATARITVNKRNIYPLTPITASEDGKLPDQIQIMPIGEWDTVPYGKLTISANDISEMVEHFNKGVRAGVPIDVDHDGKAAAGWVTSLVAKEDGLWANVEWTPLGTKLLGEKQYKFFSPEFNPTYIDPQNKSLKMDNVLIAGSIVNRPLFKELQPIVAHEGKTPLLTSEKGLAMLFIEPMKFDLNALRTKTASDVTADEKKFLQENLTSLTADEKVKFGFQAKDDVSGKEQTTTISASELIKLKEDAAQGRKAAESLRASEISGQVNSWLFSEKGGHFQPALKDDLNSFVSSLDDTQRMKFSEIVAKMPEQKLLFSENGSAEDLTAGQAADKLTLRANEMIAEAKKQGETLKFSDAVRKAVKENGQLADYKLVPVQGKMITQQGAAN
jgi:phage I-like protein